MMSWNLLGIDTSTLRAAVALRRSDGEIFVAPIDSSRRHGRELLPSIRDLLLLAQISTMEIHVIAVGLGPGSFTGLRVGLMAAKALAYATGATLVGLKSLEILAGNAPDDVDRVCVVVDAQRGDLHVADFVRGQGTHWVSDGQPRILTLEEGIAGWDEHSFILGPGLERIADRIPAGIRRGDEGQNHPDPRRVLELGLSLVEENRLDDFWALEPSYLRRSSAEDLWAKK